MSIDSDITKAVREAVSERTPSADPLWTQPASRAEVARVLGKLFAKYVAPLHSTTTTTPKEVCMYRVSIEFIDDDGAKVQRVWRDHPLADALEIVKDWSKRRVLTTVFINQL
jgi:hypothetical protein